MTSSSWQLQTPLDAIVFDCDGTLTSIEGVDELARNNGVYQEVAALTSLAMQKTGLTPTLYQARLQLIKPNKSQILKLGQAYIAGMTEHTQAVIAIFQRLQKQVYIASAGIRASVKIFGQTLNIPEENIFAVDVNFDVFEQFVSFDKTSCLINNDGKRKIIAELKQKHSHILHIGDGLNDIVTQDLVTRFVGFGGYFYRENIAKACNFYLRKPSLLSLLPLALAPMEIERLDQHEKRLYEQGVVDLKESNTMAK